MAGNQQVVKELLGSQAEQQVKITRGVGTYFREAQNGATEVEIKSCSEFRVLSRLPSLLRGVFLFNLLRN